MLSQVPIYEQRRFNENDIGLAHGISKAVTA